VACCFYPELSIVFYRVAVEFFFVPASFSLNGDGYDLFDGFDALYQGNQKHQINQGSDTSSLSEL